MPVLFGDENAILFDDPNHSYVEEKISIGKVGKKIRDEYDGGGPEISG